MTMEPEIRRELAILLAISGIFTAAAFVMAGPGWGLAALGFCLAGLGVRVFFAGKRQRRLEKLSENLEKLLLYGEPLAIPAYQEGQIAILTDQIQKMTIRLQEAAQKSQEDREMLANSLADISHQLRTPLTAMALTASRLSDPALGEGERAKCCRELQSLLSGTEWLVETLLKLSRLDAGTVSLSPQRLSAQALAERAAAPLAIPMELREQTLVLRCGGAMFRADPVWTAEALGNLLKNCMEHTPAGGTVTVTARETPLYTRLTVEDTGPGFAKEDLPHLFQRFYKGKDAPGYGIGLSLARRIVAAQDGTLEAENGPQGARFIATFYKQTV